MTDPEGRQSTEVVEPNETIEETSNNALSKVANFFNQPHLVQRYTPLLTNISLILNILSGGGIAFAVSQSIEGQTDVPPGGIELPRPSKEEQDGYEEYLINMDNACSSSAMQSEARVRLNVPPDEDIITGKKLNESKELWPVYRWICLYRTYEDSSPEIRIGLDLKKYCQDRNSRFSFGYKDYLDPNTFYCTRVDNRVEIQGQNENLQQPPPEM